MSENNIPEKCCNIDLCTEDQGKICQNNESAGKSGKV